ncbi:ceramide synthase 2-like [Dreissena polymorpha]|uniref:ceramide synthase 2-like n=1 Tax=Dreissena polymorpha TaxID=45954 RepID=UPI00226472E6|nr:ceramide synthase 2-like [Dreissena polymorpha]
MDSIYNVYWNEGFWLPKGVTWKQLENKPDSDVYLPQASDMTWSLPIGLLIFAFRFVFESYIMTPLGYSLGVKRKKILTKDLNPILEEYSKQNGNVMKRNAMEISKDTDVSVRDVERWLRDRRVNTRPSDIRKFNECGIRW